MTPPVALRLPPSMLERFDLARLIAADPRVRWADGYVSLEQFALRAHERRFARAVLRRKPNLWLFRANQRQFCGDFAVVDMSSPDKARRPVAVIELKMGAALSVTAPGSGSACVQLAGWRRLVAWIADDTGAIPRAADAALIVGGGDAVLAHLGARSPRIGRGTTDPGV